MAPRRSFCQIRAVRCVFFGTPAIALPTLEALAETRDVVAAVCQPDRPSGRGLRSHSPAVKTWAINHGMQVVQPDSLKDGELASWIARQNVDLGVVLAYGRILPQALLFAPRLGCVNLHASLLPRHRGAAPIVWSILSRDEQTGVTLMQMDEGLDTGPVLAQHKIDIEPAETAGSLTDRIAQLCAAVARIQIPRLYRGELEATAQNDQMATFAPPIRADDRRLNFDVPAVDVDARVRAMAPTPGAITQYQGRLLRILETRPLAVDSAGAPGTLSITSDRRILVATRAGSLELLRAQLEGRKPLGTRDLINGRALSANHRLGE